MRVRKKKGGGISTSTKDTIQKEKGNNISLILCVIFLFQYILGFLSPIDKFTDYRRVVKQPKRKQKET